MSSATFLCYYHLQQFHILAYGGNRLPQYGCSFFHFRFTLGYEQQRSHHISTLIVTSALAPISFYFVAYLGFMFLLHTHVLYYPKRVIYIYQQYCKETHASQLLDIFVHSSTLLTVRFLLLGSFY